MNLGDGLLFELENGKPKLILCSHGVAKNPAKLPSRPRVANVLSPRQPSCLEEAGRYREARSKAAAGAAAAAAASLHLNAATAGERGATLNTSKAHEHHVGGCIKTVAKVRSDGHKQAATVGSLRTNGKMGKPPSSRARAGAGGKAGLKAMPVGGEAGRTEGVVALTSGQLQQILDSLQTTSNDRQPPEDHQTQDEQVVLKQQQQQQWRPAPGRIQGVTPMEQVLGTERKEEQRRRWLEELDRQREEMTERRRREKLLQSQTEDHEHWCSHFDSLQRRPPGRGAAPSAPTRAPSRASEGGEWEPSSSLSLVWDATSSCRADSVGGASVDTTNGYLSGASYLRTMTALLDPAQIEERERRRLKQQEQQRAIDAQVEERRVQREREKAKRREEEEEEARRLQSRYQLDAVRQKRDRQESRLKRQAELHALQERTCLSRTEPLPLPPPLRLCPDPTQTRGGPNSKVETVARVQSISAAINNERHRVQAPSHLPPLVMDFIPYIRTDETTLDPLEHGDDPPTHTQTDERSRKTPTCRRLEVLRGLAQLRQSNFTLHDDPHRVWVSNRVRPLVCFKCTFRQSDAGPFPSEKSHSSEKEVNFFL
ncbi:hypothetical protein F2P81_012205 [Scophthalmus maximus]|uniref:CCDC66 domain-containing protein n=1 Tax=Scophthalmus maximus TaxID=52904 RepID=A0A6A4SMN8_SCOMX|nr:hypothetical protein F2P81_012205 [Scophthalmus maximus]